MSLYNVFESAMSAQYDLSDMLEKIHKYHIIGGLTDAEHDKLVSLARNKADPMGGLDIREKLADFENRIRALEEAKATEGGESAEEDVEEYQIGKWYKAGDKVLFEGAVYECVAPNGYIRAWSPADHPDSWELKE